jgi:hypothetical protein
MILVEKEGRGWCHVEKKGNPAGEKNRRVQKDVIELSNAEKKRVCQMEKKRIEVTPCGTERKVVNCLE